MEDVWSICTLSHWVNLTNAQLRNLAIHPIMPPITERAKTNATLQASDGVAPNFSVNVDHGA